VSPRWFTGKSLHLQPTLPRRLAEKLGRFKSLSAACSRLLIAQCYLHSISPPNSPSHSAARIPRGRRLTLQAEFRGPPNTQRFAAWWKKLWTQRGNLRMISLSPGLQIARRDADSTAAEPFRCVKIPPDSNPTCSAACRVKTRAHRPTHRLPVDPATTITLSVMANAARIAGRTENCEKLNVLITGATGYVGSLLAGHLSRAACAPSASPAGTALRPREPARPKTLIGANASSLRLRLSAPSAARKIHCANAKASPLDAPNPPA